MSVVRVVELVVPVDSYIRTKLLGLAPKVAGNAQRIAEAWTPSAARERRFQH